MSDKDGGRLKNYCKEDYNISFHRVDLFFGGCQPLLLITVCARTILSKTTLSLHQFFMAVVCIQNLPDEGQGQVAALRMEWMEVGRAKNSTKQQNEILTGSYWKNHHSKIKLSDGNAFKEALRHTVSKSLNSGFTTGQTLYSSDIFAIEMLLFNCS